LQSAVKKAKSYREFANGHLPELTPLRFLLKNWPEGLRQLWLSLNGGQILLLSQLHGQLKLAEFSAALLQQLSQSTEWQYSRTKVAVQAKTARVKPEELRPCPANNNRTLAISPGSCRTASVRIVT
jgi:hypothetical protein